MPVSAQPYDAYDHRAADPYDPADYETGTTYDDYDALPVGPLLPGDPIGPVIRRTGRKTTLALSLLITAVLGGAWTFYGDQLADLAQSLATPAAKPETAALAAPSTAASAKPEPSTPTALPPVEAPAAAPPITTAVLPPATEAYDAPKSEPLPKPVADPADPHQARALAAGLHPGISRALLTRLTAADYKNAATAIKTALAEPAGDAVTAWPKPRKPEQALFEVHFVPGATDTCRRYVVTVEKDGWITTALPMEKCGLAPRTANRG